MHVGPIKENPRQGTEITLVAARRGRTAGSNKHGLHLLQALSQSRRKQTLSLAGFFRRQCTCFVEMPVVLDIM